MGLVTNLQFIKLVVRMIHLLFGEKNLVLQ
uniref:Uncharacterized protein n=1 Tax=Setaria italica TaxID=4555 RepID=K4AN51_SETIT